MGGFLIKGVQAVSYACTNYKRSFRCKSALCLSKKIDNVQPCLLSVPSGRNPIVFQHFITITHPLAGNPEACCLIR